MAVELRITNTIQYCTFQKSLVDCGRGHVCSRSSMIEKIGGQKYHGICLFLTNLNLGLHLIRNFIGLRKKIQFGFPQNMGWSSHEPAVKN